MTTQQKMTYLVLRTVPIGRVTTYKDLAHAIGSYAYRAIGQYMRNNPYPFMSCKTHSLRVPCHRVVSSNGYIGGFMGKMNGIEVEQKIALLKSEGVTVVDGKIKDFEDVRYVFGS